MHVCLSNDYIHMTLDLAREKNYGNLFCVRSPIMSCSDKFVIFCLLIYSHQGSVCSIMCTSSFLFKITFEL